MINRRSIKYGKWSDKPTGLCDSHGRTMTREKVLMCVLTNCIRLYPESIFCRPVPWLPGRHRTSQDPTSSECPSKSATTSGHSKQSVFKLAITPFVLMHLIWKQTSTISGKNATKFFLDIRANWRNYQYLIIFIDLMLVRCSLWCPELSVRVIRHFTYS